MPRLSRELAAPSLFILGLACVCLAALGAVAHRAAAQDNAPPAPAKEETKAAVYGRAVYAGTGRPVRRARVTLIGVAGDRTDFGGLTDARGEFRIRDVRAGRYYAVLDVPGVMSPLPFISYGRSGALFPPGEVDKYFEVIEVDGRADKGVTVRAYPGAAIGGKVTYAGGDPAPGVFVHVLRRAGGRLAQMTSGNTTYAAASLTGGAGARTDDRGAYRVAGLPPGDYVLAVSEAESHGDEHEQSGGYAGELYDASLNDKLLMTYYPSVTSAKEATTVSVGAGDERADVDITIAERETRTVAGVVRGRGDRQPVANATVLIAGKDDSGQLSYIPSSGQVNQVRTDEQGRWQFKEIPEGLYTISVTPAEESEMNASVTVTNANVTVVTNAKAAAANMNSAAPPRRRKRYAPAWRDVQVSGGDVTELAVELSEGGRVSGTVAVEGDKPLPQSIQVVMVRAAARSIKDLGGEEPPRANAQDGTFTVEGVPPGKFFLRLFAWDGRKGPGPYLKEITWNGRDLMREPLEVGEGDEVSGVRVVYSSDAALLRARLFSGADKKPAQGVAVFLLPADMSKWSFLSPPAYCATGEGGECVVSAAPGEYLVVYMRRVAGADFEAEARRRAATAPRVSLRAGETTDFEAVVRDAQ